MHRVPMKIAKVVIKNYRSIENLEIKMDESPIILVGINESGKTNILRALSLLSPENSPTVEDVREPLPSEQPVTDSWIKFYLKLNESEIKSIFENIKSQFLCVDFDEPIVSKKKDSISLEKFCSFRCDGIYKVSVKEGKKNAQYYSLPEGYSICKGWKKLSKTCPKNSIYVGEGGAVDLSSFSFVNVNTVKDVAIPEDYLEDATPDDVNDIIGKVICRLIEGALPDCVFWEYTESNLLPGKISIDKFKDDPGACLPLKYMFELAGCNDIEDAIESAQEKSKGLTNLLNRVAEQATQHIRRAWKECDKIKISLVPNGSNIDAGIQEDNNNIFDFAKRSDGFKRFISFLLIISTRQRSKVFENSLLIIDEPDMGLHPSGARYLKDELKKIGENNYVIYSTHSIFMIDEEAIGRHLIVRKTKEVTNVEVVGHSNIKDEEVIYNALGHSVFATLKRKNIIFEGWRDKRLFDVAMKATHKEAKNLKVLFKDIGTCFAQGTKGIPNVTPLLELADRDYIVISDNDDAAIRAQQEHKGSGRWYKYSDILLQSAEIKTGEDFIISKAFMPILKKIKASYPILDDLTDGELNVQDGKINVIKKWFKKGGIPADAIKRLLEQIKSDVFDNLKPAQISDVYWDLLRGIPDKFLSNK